MFIAREKEYSKLKQSFLLGSSLFIRGAKGMGKTQLISHFSKSEKKNFLWITLDKLRSLEEVLSFELMAQGIDNCEEKSVEWLLKMMSSKWQNYDAIVWDNINFLSKKYQNLLINFVLSSPNFPNQLFISDMSIKDDVFLEVPRIDLEAFSENEVALFFEEVTGKKESLEVIKRAYNKTGGVPLLLNLFMLSEGSIDSYWKKQISELNESDKLFVLSSAIMMRPMNNIEAQSILELGSIEALFIKLQSQLLLTPQSDNQSLEVTRFIATYALENFDKELIAKARQRVTSCLTEFGHEKNSIEVIFHTLSSNDQDLIEEFLKKDNQFLLPELESKSSEFVKELSELCKANLKAYAWPEHIETIINRYLCKALFLIGERAAALEYMESYFNKYKDLSKLKVQGLFLALEYAQLLNRFGYFDKALDFSRKLIPYTNDLLNILARVEQNTALLNINIDEALPLFEKLYKDAESQKSEELEYKMAMAQLCFQYGRCLYHLERMDEAEKLFTTSSEYFEEIGNPYFSSVCKLNLAWVLIKNHDYKKLEKIITSVGDFCKQFGHDYVNAGLNVIDARKERFHLNLETALIKINAALAQLGEKAPFYPKKDTLIEKIKILLQLGKRNEAGEILAFLVEDGKNHKFSESEEYRKTNFEIEIWNKDLEQELEGWKIFDYGDFEENTRMSYSMQIGEEPNIQPAFLTNPMLKGFFYEGMILQNLKKGEKEKAWGYLTKWEKIISSINEVSEQKVLFEFLMALNSDEKEKDNSLNEFSEKLTTLSFDSQVKEAYISCIKGIEKPENAKWERCFSRDRYRFKIIQEAFMDQEAGKYFKITPGKKALVEKAQTKLKKDFILIDDVGELWSKGKIKDEFSGRKKLRDLLSLLMEVSPKPVGKIEIVPALWGEIYDPFLHDSRVYTSIQRLRKLIGIDDILINQEDGYSWNPKYSFILYKRRSHEGKLTGNRNQALIIKVFEKFKDQGDEFLSRKILVDATGLSESQIKRELGELLEKLLIERSGQGRGVKYKLL